MARLTEEMLAGEEISGQVPPMVDNPFILRVIETDNKPSKRSGCKMVHIRAEIVRPESLPRSGKSYNVSGQKVDYYFPIESLKGEDVTKRMRRQYKEFRQMMGLDPMFDLDNPEHEDLRGLGFRAQLHSEERTALETNEDGERVQVRNEDGSPISRGWRWSLGATSEIYNRVDLNGAA